MANHCPGCGDVHEEDDGRSCSKCVNNANYKQAERTRNINNGVPAVFAALYPQLRALARSKGYALAIHGSLVRDMDLIATPWVDEVVEPDELAQAMQDELGGWLSDSSGQIYSWKVEGTEKPHGRRAYTLRMGGEHILHLDLSVIPPVKRE